MMKAIALHAVIPVREQAAEQSEQTTQMLFGEVCSVLEQQHSWYRIKLHADGQQGWADAKMLTPMSQQEYQNYVKQLTNAAYVAMPMAYAVSENNGQTIPLTAGTRLTNYHSGTFHILGVPFRIDDSMVLSTPLEMTQTHLLQVVRFFLNLPYLWGGKNAMGMDCSGFTQIILSLFGKSLRRNASEQAQQGRLIRYLSSAQPCDLVFFSHYDEQEQTTTSKVTHVGILIDNERVIHCSGRVKVEKIDEIGIFSVERADVTHPNGQYTHRLLSIRRP